jgi:peptidoglycan hydrolase-like protein with peptidoglycan-binding domain
VAAGVAGVLIANNGGTDTSAEPSVELNYGEAVVTDLVQTESFDGTLGTVDGDPVTTQFSGTVTAAASAGEVVEQGDVLFSIDGDPIVLLYGDVPAYRDLAIGVDNLDVSAGSSGTITEVAATGTALQQGDVIYEVSNQATELQLAQMRQQVASAESQVANAYASYQRVVEDAVPADVTSAESSVMQAQAALDRLLEPPSDAQLATAEAQVAAAQNNLNTLLEGPSEVDIASAEASVTSAQANVESAQRSTDSAMTNLVIALDAYCSHPDQPVGFDCPDIPLSSSERDALAAAIEGDPTSSLVGVTQNLMASDGSYRNANSQLATARASLESARERLEALYDPASSAAVQQAEASLASAQENLTSLLEGASEADIFQAKANLATAETRLTDLLAGANASDRSQAWASVESARASLEIALLQESDLLSTTAKTVLMYGTFPAWRALSVDSAPGPDIAQLEEALLQLGYDPDGLMLVDEVFDENTMAAVERWQKDLGTDATGFVDLGQIVFAPGPAQVWSTASVGEYAGSGAPVVSLISGEAMNGADVAQLENALASLGFDPGTADGEFTDETRLAVLQWQAATGLEEDGVVDMGEVAFLEGPVRVSDQLSGVGSRVNSGGPILAVSSSDKVVRIDLPAREQGIVSVGDEVIVVMPDFSETPGVVASVATTASVDQGNQAVFEVIVELLDPSVAEGLDEAPVEVDVISESVENVLAVPVSSLVALSEGGYAVRVDDGAGGSRLVGVDPGFFADGLVEITSSQLKAGDRVVVP